MGKDECLDENGKKIDEDVKMRDDEKKDEEKK